MKRLAWAAQLFMCASVWMVYTQVLWLSLAQNNPKDNSGHNAAADASSNAVRNPNVNAATTDTSNSGVECVSENVVGNTVASRGNDDKGNSAENPPAESASNTTTLRLLDTATSVRSSIISLLLFGLHLKRFRKLKIAYLVAITAWLLQIPALITPATLVVVPSMNVTDQKPVPVPDITNIALNKSFAYDSPMVANASIDASDLKFVGARTIVLTIGAATASSGRIQDINPPIGNSSYQGYGVSFAAPYVRCQDANESETAIINATVNKIMSTKHDTYIEAWNVFSAFIPIFGPPVDDIDVNTTSVEVDGRQVTSLWEADLQRPLNTSTNEIWMRFYRYKKNSAGEYITTDPNNQRIAPDLHFLTCKLYNASYYVDFSWTSGVQSVVNTSIHINGLVAYPNDTKGHPSDLVAHACTSVFLVLANQIVGRMAFYNNTVNSAEYIDAPPHYSSFQTRIPETSLPFHEQRLQDKAVAKNQTLGYLIEELGFNITISLLHDPLLSRLENVTATHSDDRIQYDYIWRNLAISYSLAVAATAFWSLVGLLAYWRNQAAFDLSLSTIVSVTRHPELDGLFPECCYGVQPLPEESLDAPLEVRETLNGRRPGRNIVLVGAPEPVCRACNPPPPPPRTPENRRVSVFSLEGIKKRRRSSINPAPPNRRPEESSRSPPASPGNQ